MRDEGWTFFKKLLDCPFHEARNEGGCPSCNIIKFPIGSMDLDTEKLQYLKILSKLYPFQTSNVPSQ